MTKDEIESLSGETPTKKSWDYARPKFEGLGLMKQIEKKIVYTPSKTYEEMCDVIINYWKEKVSDEKLTYYDSEFQRKVHERLREEWKNFNNIK